MLLWTEPKAEPRKLAEMDLEQAPSTNENITWGARVYRVVDRAWSIEYREITGEKFPVLKCALLVRQIAGAPHVLTPGLVTN